MRSLCVAVAVCTGSTALAQLAIVGNVTGAYEDISGTGTALNLGDDGQITIQVPFTNLVFTSNIVTISNNLAIGFGPAAAASSAAPTNSLLPSNALFDGEQALCVLWDNPGQNLPAANVYYQEFIDHYTIQWHRLPKGAPGSTIIAEVQVFDGGGSRSNKFAQMFYPDVEQPGVRALGTVGYQSARGTTQFNDINYSFNSNNVEFINNNTVLTLIPGPSAGALLAGAAGAAAMMSRRRKV